jgi:hypothetical protein
MAAMRRLTLSADATIVDNRAAAPYCVTLPQAGLAS